MSDGELLDNLPVSDATYGHLGFCVENKCGKSTILEARYIPLQGLRFTQVRHCFDKHGEREGKWHHGCSVPRGGQDVFLASASVPGCICGCSDGELKEYVKKVEHALQTHI